jgi:adenine-specific DNA-methyltransferase
MILGDSLQVMASLAEREALRGKVQCIYFDPPYGIKFNSNFQWSTSDKTGSASDASEKISRESEQVKAFRDTWRDGIHSYLTYLRDRFTVSRDLLADIGSIFVQIGDENVHRVRAIMDEVFGDRNFIALCTVRKTTSDSTELLGSTCDYVLWFTKNKDAAKGRTIWAMRGAEAEERYSGDYGDGRKFQLGGITSSRPPGEGDLKAFRWFGREFKAENATFKTTETGLTRAAKADRLAVTSGAKLRYRRFHNDFGYAPITNLWTDISGAVQSRSDPKVYVVQSSTTIVERCVLMASDPGDLVLDPTCGSGTTATVAEQLGRRWITIDTSRVALALARARIMGARYPFYLLADSREGQEKESEISRAAPSTKPVHGNIRHGFVYDRVSHITLKSIANNAEIDVIWDEWQAKLEPLRGKLNAALKKQWQEWEIPRELDKTLPDIAKTLHSEWWAARIARQKQIDASIATKAEFEFLYDKPYTAKKSVSPAPSPSRA